MKTGEDFRREFPQTEDGFRDAAFSALQALQEHQEEKRMKLKPMIAMVMALVLLMGAGVAATFHRWSLQDFMPHTRITASQAEWEKMISAFEPVTAECAVADVMVREALFDGYALYIVVDVTPRLSGDFFLSHMVGLDAQASDAAGSLPDEMTVREYMAAEGLTRAFAVNLHTGVPGISFVPEMKINEDGSMTFYHRQRMQQHGDAAETLDMKLHVTMNGLTSQGFYSVEIPLSIERLPVVEEAVSREGDGKEFPGSGVMLTNMRLIRTPLSTYVTVDAQITDEAAYGSRFGKYVFNFVSPEGGMYGPGPFNLSGFMRDAGGPDQAPGELYYMATMTATELPDVLVMSEMPWGSRDPEQASDIWTIPLVPVN